MKRFHALLLKKHEIVVDLMQAETGKARRMSFEEVCDVAMTTSHYLKNAKRILRRAQARRRRAGRLARAPRCACPRASSA